MGSALRFEARDGVVGGSHKGGIKGGVDKEVIRRRLAILLAVPLVVGAPVTMTVRALIVVSCFLDAHKLHRGDGSLALVVEPSLKQVSELFEAGHSSRGKGGEPHLALFVEGGREDLTFEAFKSAMKVYVDVVVYHMAGKPGEGPQRGLLLHAQGASYLTLEEELARHYMEEKGQRFGAKGRQFSAKTSMVSKVGLEGKNVGEEVVGQHWSLTWELELMVRARREPDPRRTCLLAHPSYKVSLAGRDRVKMAPKKNIDKGKAPMVEMEPSRPMTRSCSRGLVIREWKE
ncbi:hypothetical protein ACLOJK_027374 [Asimina triloba]